MKIILDLNKQMFEYIKVILKTFLKKDLKYSYEVNPFYL